MARKYKLTQDGPEVQALLNKIDGLKGNQTPGQGVEPVPMENLSLDGVLYAFLTKTVNDLANYYTKSETYTKSEVQTLIAAIPGFTYESVEELPQSPSAATMWKLYLVPSSDPQAQNVKDEFITVDNGESANPRYTWEQIGSTAIDLSGYVTTEALNTALADYVTSDALTTALAGLNDVKYTAQSLTDSQKLQARTNIGATAPEVFWAEYGVTTYNEVVNAYNGGKFVVVKRDNGIVYKADFISNPIKFGGWNALTQHRLELYNDNRWTVGSSSTENVSNKSQSVETDKDSTTKYPSTKAVADAITAAKQIFFATHGTTTYQQVEDAYAAGKVIVCLKDNFVYTYSGKVGTTMYFSIAFGSQNIRFISLSNQNVWSNGDTISLQQSTARVSTLTGNETSTERYPNCKAVYDALPVAMTDAQLDTLFDANWQ